MMIELFIWMNVSLNRIAGTQNGPTSKNIWLRRFMAISSFNAPATAETDKPDN